MGTIKGDPKIVERIEKARPGDPAVYVNLDAVKQLPDLFESHSAPVKFDIKSDFTNVGTEKKPSWYPTAKLMYAIADKCGISGEGDSVIEPIMEEIDWSELTMSNVPMIIKKKIGYTVRKRSKVLTEDGIYRISSERVGKHDAWNDCLKVWAKEEKATNGYDPQLIKTWASGDRYYEYEYNGQKKQVALKYDTKYKRKLHFLDELDKAVGQADTKAHLKTIRELAGLKTGYTTEDLKEGVFYFVKITRSELAMKMEQAAQLEHIGRTGRIETKATKLLFSGADDVIPEVEGNNMSIGKPGASVVDISDAKEIEEQPKERDKLLVWIINKYTEDAEVLKNILPEKQQNLANIKEWLTASNAAINYDGVNWKKAVAILTEIENDLPEFMRVTHEVLI